VKDLTPDVIKNFRDVKASPTERELDPSRVKHLRRKADDGQLVTFHWVLAKHKGELIRMNGQHSSTMLAELDGQLPTGLKVHLEEYDVDNGDALAVLFRQFDDRKSSRSPADISAVYQGLQPALVSVDKKMAKLAIDGYAWFQRNVEEVAPPIGDGVYALFNVAELHPFIAWIAEVQTSKTREMQTKPVVAAMFGTFNTNEQAARTFWDEVSRGGDPDQEDQPQTVLDKWLRTLYEEGKGDDFGPRNYYQGCVYAWNASRENKHVTSIKSDVKKNFAQIRD
jgi:hypothetical protein